MIKEWGGGATLETEQKESVALPMSCTFFSCFFLLLVTQFPSRMCKFGVEVSRLTSLPPSRPTPLLPSLPPLPLESLCPRAIHLNFNERQPSCEDLKPGIFGRLLEVPGHAFFT